MLLPSVCLATLAGAVQAFADDEPDEPASPVAVAMAATLIGSLFVMMLLNYALNTQDPERRKLAYEVVSSTTSIFCAVLLFGSLNETLKDIFEWMHVSPGWEVVVSFMHRLLWIVVLQVTLAAICRVQSIDADVREVAEAARERNRIMDGKDRMAKLEVRVECYGTLFSHIGGFAAINLWGSVQHLSAFGASWGRSLAVVPIALAVQVIEIAVAHAIRSRVINRNEDASEAPAHSVSAASGDRLVRASSAGVGEDSLERLWDKKTKEAENDVMGLALSFTIVQSIRFGICGTLPSIEGEESVAHLFTHSLANALWLYLFGGICLLAWAGMLWLLRATEEHPLIERIVEISTVVLHMSFAWSVFYATQGLLASMGGWEEQNTTLLSIVLALVITLVCYVMAWFLDKLADQMAHENKTREPFLDAIIKVVAILVGFAWEQNFDTAVEAIGSQFEQPVFPKFALSAACALLLVPAWQWYVLPMIVHDGWRFGFVASAATRCLVFSDEEVFKEQMKAYLELQKHFATFGEHCVQPAETIHEDFLAEVYFGVDQEGKLPAQLQRQSSWRRDIRAGLPRYLEASRTILETVAQRRSSAQYRDLSP